MRNFTEKEILKAVSIKFKKDFVSVKFNEDYSYIFYTHDGQHLRLSNKEIENCIIYCELKKSCIFA